MRSLDEAMNGTTAAELGSSQRAGKGFPQLLRPGMSYTLRRTALAGIALVALGVAIGATTTAIEGHADAGIDVESGYVVAVSTTGFAWRDGIRPGQRVIDSARADADEGWFIVTQGSGGQVESREAPVLAALRNSLLFALVGLGAGCLGFVFLRTNRDWCLPMASLALACASVPLLLANHFLAAPTLLLAGAVPAIWAAWRLRRRRWLAAGVAVAAGAVLGGWLFTYTSGLPAGELEQARRAMALGGTGLLMAERAANNRPARPIRWLSLESISVVVGAAVLVTGLALVYFAGFPAPLIAVAMVLGLLAAPAVRAALGRRLEAALMADLRAQVTADVAEEERGRLARELHDAPLQELSAVIRRLELVPGAESESSSLRGIADQLRSVSIDLHPPMLDDIGLPAALDFLAEQCDSPETAVFARLEDKTGLERSNRPPAAVEFALYRIVREAVNNALSHAKARNVALTGSISPTIISLSIVDDGIGVQPDAPRRASGRGRIGIGSMRRRAQAIGAELNIEGTPAGTRVLVEWRA